MNLQLIKRTKAFDGWLERYSHQSNSCRSEMKFSVFLPPKATSAKVPVLYWLSGLTCTDENFMMKAGALKKASELGLAIVTPDTSPRGLNLPDESDDWSFGVGAGFYLNATQVPWERNYKMYDYVVEELPSLIEENFPIDPMKKSISGHSMGGHGALIIGLRNPQKYKSVSAFAPICAPMQCSWGQKAFKNYLGENSENWKNYDATELISKTKTKLPLLIDQGTNDEFLESQLKPDLLKKACEKNNYPLTLRLQEGYDHSYYFVSTFIEEHLDWHLAALGK